MQVSEIIQRMGGPAKAAAALGITAPSIIGWINRGQVPAVRVVAVARMLGVPPHEIRPDVFPVPERRGAA